MAEGSGSGWSIGFLGASPNGSVFDKRRKNVTEVRTVSDIELDIILGAKLPNGRNKRGFHRSPMNSPAIVIDTIGSRNQGSPQAIT
jgi:hypothetical protein